MRRARVKPGQASAWVQGIMARRLFKVATVAQDRMHRLGDVALGRQLLGRGGACLISVPRRLPYPDPDCACAVACGVEPEPSLAVAARGLTRTRSVISRSARRNAGNLVRVTHRGQRSFQTAPTGRIHGRSRPLRRHRFCFLPNGGHPYMTAVLRTLGSSTPFLAGRCAAWMLRCRSTLRLRHMLRPLGRAQIGDRGTCGDLFGVHA
jgi:hypothetical protein